ncbi:uncharacterized protein [Patagioenas fasciata]|uniref:uncharacterized protein n=1 Tax=Patagioenas fasciata TaxID=372321 RepID=UPI003A997FAB
MVLPGQPGRSRRYSSRLFRYRDVPSIHRRLRALRPSVRRTGTPGPPRPSAARCPRYRASPPPAPGGTDHTVSQQKPRLFAAQRPPQRAAPARRSEPPPPGRHRDVAPAPGTRLRRRRRLRGGVYLDLCLIFLLLRFSLRIRFLRHLALMAVRRRRAQSRRAGGGGDGGWRRMEAPGGGGPARWRQRQPREALIARRGLFIP